MMKDITIKIITAVTTMLRIDLMEIRNEYEYDEDAEICDYRESIMIEMTEDDDGKWLILYFGIAVWWFVTLLDDDWDSNGESKWKVVEFRKNGESVICISLFIAKWYAVNEDWFLMTV